MNKTKISWTDYTSNPIRARDKRTGKMGWWCSHASTGCLHCYSETLNNRYGNQVPYHAQEADNIEFVLNEKEVDAWKKLPAGSKLFAFDMLDLFHENMPEEFIDRAFAEMWKNKHVTFQILTKRAKRMFEYFSLFNPRGGIGNIDRVDKIAQAADEEYGRSQLRLPMSNVWLGVSVENQKAADERIPLLLETPAAVRFLSCEPLLGDIQFERVIEEAGPNDDSDTYWNMLTGIAWFRDGFEKEWRQSARIDWVICGGESGPHYREMNLDWARSIRDQCVAAGVPFFFKQQSAYRSETSPTLDGVEWHQFPNQ